MPVNTSRTTYREHTDTENILKLIFVPLILQQPQRHEFLMHTTYGFFSSFFLMKIRSSKIMQ